MKDSQRHTSVANFYLGRLTNTLGWFHRELGNVSRASEYDQESVELGRRYRIPNVEVSALINVGLDYLALGQNEPAKSYLTPTLDRVQREAFGAHRWRWKIRLLMGLTELSYTTREYEQALRYVEEGLKEAQSNTSQKYVALAGRYAARSSESSEIPTQQGQNCNVPSRLRTNYRVHRSSTRLPMILVSGTKAQARNEKRRHCMAKPNPRSSRWQRLWRMTRYARPSCNRHWYKKFTKGLHGWVSNTP